MHLQILNHSARPVPRKFLEAWVARLDRLAAREVSSRLYRGKALVIVFVGPKEQRRLNQRYRGRDYATDVLSFESGDPEALGELVICPHVITRQAREHGLLVREELGYMVLHGFLHLLGYDHERSKAEAKRMFAIQDRLFDRLLSRAS